MKIKILLLILLTASTIINVYLMSKKNNHQTTVTLTDDTSYQKIKAETDSIIHEMQVEREKLIDSLKKTPTDETIKIIYIPIRNAIDSSKWSNIDSVLSEIY